MICRIPAISWSECVVAASGPSLTQQVAQACRWAPVVAVNDAYRLFPFARVLYACDARWWEVHQGCPAFSGEKWSSHGEAARIRHNDKRAAAEKFGLSLVRGRDGDGFSFEPGVIHYGSNSGFQAINLALQMGARRIVLVGFDMHANNGRHFFGDHPAPLRNNASYANFIKPFERAAKKLPAGIEIFNATPGSALRCFPMVNLHDIAAPAA
jgi:hypothetical protein